MQNRKSVEKRNISVRIETYSRLEKYKIRMINEKGSPALSFDEVITNLLDRVR